jgi:hypothetical protein
LISDAYNNKATPLVRERSRVQSSLAAPLPNQESVGSTSQGVVQYATDLLFKDLWLRPDLAPRDRSLVTGQRPHRDGPGRTGTLQKCLGNTEKS